MFVCCECRVLSGRGLCDELITCREESYRLWCVVVCDLENLKKEEATTRVGSQCHSKKKCSISNSSSSSSSIYSAQPDKLQAFEGKPSVMRSLYLNR